MSSPETDAAPSSGAALAAAVADPLQQVGAAYYFDPATLAVGKEHGLDGFRFYFLGRGGPLGDVEPRVVSAAFGYFNPEVVAAMWASGRERLAPRDAGRLHLRCAYDFARSRFGEVEGLEAWNEAAATVVEALDPTSLPLFAAISAEPAPTDAPARAMHPAILLREGRGSVHLLALVANGLDSKLAHRIKRPDAYELFGWKDDPEITGEAAQLHEQAEELTNDIMGRAFDALEPDAMATFADGGRRLAAAL